MLITTTSKYSFNTQPPEGGWFQTPKILIHKKVSTHSRPKAAGQPRNHALPVVRVSTHSRPKAAGFPRRTKNGTRPCFNTQPPEGGWFDQHRFTLTTVMFQHTAARRRLVINGFAQCCDTAFQHTAARRRLALEIIHLNSCFRSFNTQPPEGGWSHAPSRLKMMLVSTHSRPKAAGYSRR